MQYLPEKDQKTAICTVFTISDVIYCMFIEGFLHKAQFV